MPIIGVIASSLLKNFYPAANTPMGYIVAAGATGIKRFPFTTETYSATLAQTAQYGDYANADNSPFANYKFGNGGNLSLIEQGNRIFKFGFFAETISLLTATTTYSMFNAGGATNNGIAAYIVGGMDPSGASGVSTCNKMLYSTDTPTLLGTTLSTARGATGGVYNANTASYHGGGTANNSTPVFSQINKMTFSTDTLSTLSATLPVATAINPTSNSTYASTAGLWFGGFNGNPDIANIQRLAFSNETTSSPANLGSPSRANSTISKNDTAGYFNAGTGSVGNTQKLVYSNNSISTMGVISGFPYGNSMNNQGA
jgi:hypothetical protein